MISAENLVKLRRLAIKSDRSYEENKQIYQILFDSKVRDTFFGLFQD